MKDGTVLKQSPSSSSTSSVTAHVTTNAAVNSPDTASSLTTNNNNNNAGSVLINVTPSLLTSNVTSHDVLNRQTKVTRNSSVTSHIDNGSRRQSDRTCSSRSVGDKPEVMVNGSSGTRATLTLNTSDAVVAKLSSVKGVTSQYHRQNGSGSHAPTNGVHSPSSTSAQCWRNGNRSHYQVCDSLSPRNSQQDQVEMTDIDSLEEIADHPFFALTDDCGQLQDAFQIVSDRGTVRGVRNRVKAGIAVYVDQQQHRKLKVC